MAIRYSSQVLCRGLAELHIVKCFLFFGVLLRPGRGEAIGRVATIDGTQGT